MSEKFLASTDNFGVKPYQQPHSENISKWMYFDERELMFISTTLKYPVTQEAFKSFRDSFQNEKKGRDFLETDWLTL